MKPTYEDLQQELAALDAINRQLNKRVAAQAEELAAAGRTIEALAAENARMQSAIERHKEGFTICEACGEENGSWNDDVCRVLGETPATDAAIADFRASGAELCVRALVTSDDDGFDDAPNICAMVAHQLRAEASK